MTTIALTLPVARRSAIRIPRRDLALVSGDSLTLAITVVQSDRPGAAPLNLVLAYGRVRLRVWRPIPPAFCLYDYGFHGMRHAEAIGATVTNGAAGQAEIHVTGSHTAGWHGIYSWALQFGSDTDSSTLCSGTLQMQPGLPMPPLYILTDDGVPVLTDDSQNWIAG
jgi:hypothetical protein